MTYGLSRLKVEKLVRQLGLDTEDKLNFRESQFFRQTMKKRGAQIWRHGWPDFLIHTEHLGFVGVEVKCKTDDLSPRQKAMFAALDRAGLRCYVWCDACPNKLTPWKDYRSTRQPKSTEDP